MKAHIDALFYERVTDISTREAIREAGGFCSRHSRLVSRQADALGTALIYADVLRHQLRAIESSQYERPATAGSALSRFFDSKSGDVVTRLPCPLCQTAREQERLAVDSLVGGLENTEFADRFKDSSGLCLPHFRLAHERCRNEDVWQLIRAVQQEMLERLIADLEELARKHDYRFAHEERGSEASSWRRALCVAAGWPEG
jgi:hypothetical protein